jgi:SecD/SecF fusion protein
MNRNIFWKFAFVVFVVMWSLWEVTPVKNRNLIDEFEKRAENPGEVIPRIIEDARKLEADRPENKYRILRDAIGDTDISTHFPSIEVEDEEDVTRAILNQLQKDSAGQIKLGLDLQGGTSFKVEMSTNSLTEAGSDLSGGNEYRRRLLSSAIEVLRKRIDKFGVAEPVLQPSGENRIDIQVPGLSEEDNESAKRQIEKAAFLEFRLVHTNSANLLEIGEPGYEVLREKRVADDGTEEEIPYLVTKKAVQGLTGKYLTRASAVPDPLSNRPEILFTFNQEGARIFDQITSGNVGNQLAIVLDGELYSAPTITEPIRGGSGQITGDFTFAEAVELANVLENPLEAPVRIIEERRVDPSLGQDSISSGIRATMIGLIAVAAFMLVYYLLAGLVANVALILNLIILLGVMCSIDTTLTLPGIAGIVLTIGMAVDANVLIFERIREEINAKKSLRGSIAAGYDKALSTILDANITTLISSIILINLGTGPVKGFGVTLTIGISVSMFTALVVTRIIFDFLVARGILKKLPMLQLIKATKFDFLNIWKIAFGISWAIVLIGVAYGLYRGKNTLGVDFAGGDALMIDFVSEQRVEVDKLRDAIGRYDLANPDYKAGEPLIQYQKDLASGEETLMITTAFESGDRVYSFLQNEFPDAGFQKLSQNKVGPTVGQEILKSAIIASLLALFGILIYVALRYEFSFAIGAVIAVIHDVAMTMGWFCLTGRQFSAPMVAAILTIIGFSINDTIVIFDRIREDLKLGMRGSFKEIMNGALNKTLSRTLITSGTLFLSVFALYIFGGGVINDFAFTFLVGIITGTYSSIYIASAIVLWWHKGERPKMAETTQITSVGEVDTVRA